MADTEKNKSQTDAQDAQSVRRELHWLEILNFIGQIVLAGVGIVAAIIYGHQLHEMRVANQNTTDAVKVARDTLTETQLSNARQAILTEKSRISSEAASNAALQNTVEDFRRDQRPYLAQSNKSIENPTFHPNTVHPENGGQIVWNWYMTNYGKTPAVDISMKQEMSLDGKPFATSYGIKGDAGGKGVDRVGFQGPSGESFDTVISAPMPKEEYERIMAAGGDISIRVHINYTGLDGTRYETVLCYRRLNLGAISFCPGNYIR